MKTILMHLNRRMLLHRRHLSSQQESAHDWNPEEPEQDAAFLDVLFGTRLPDVDQKVDGPFWSPVLSDNHGGGGYCVGASFDNLPHHVIMQAVARHVADGNVLDLIQRFLTAGVMEDGVFKPTTVGTPQGGVISPLLANIVLNHLDWQLDKAGFRFVRYADDFVVICRSHREAREAHDLVQHILEGQLELQLSPEKTHITTYGKGYEFLGFFLSSRSRRMRDKSEQKFKDKIRELTVRKHNLDAETITKLNRVIRGTANYFAAPFSTSRWRFQKLDSWVRMRLRCMKRKRKNYNDNRKLRARYFHGKLGLLTLEQFCCTFDTHGNAYPVIPRRGATLSGVAR